MKYIYINAEIRNLYCILSLGGGGGGGGGVAVSYPKLLYTYLLAYNSNRECISCEELC